MDGRSAVELTLRPRETRALRKQRRSIVRLESSARTDRDASRRRTFDANPRFAVTWSGTYVTAACRVSKFA